MASIASVIGSGADTSTNPPASTKTSTDALANESTFLQLLVAQIKNQDPTTPMDSTAFLSQLAQFSQLEQTVGIRQDIENGTYAFPTAPASTATDPAASTTGA
jgi:flagellar basal-body rod modification protein FlgD